jgi:protein-tyrosine phosphatase
VRWIELDGAVNVRDLGGLPSEDGRRVAEHTLLRGDNLQDLSAADVALLVGQIGLTTVIDLRSRTEVTAEGPGPLTRVPQVRHAYHSVLAERGAAADAASALASRRDDSAARYPADPRCGSYLGYLEDQPDQVVGALRAICSSAGAALVNCAAGKDRTGVIVALALSAAGVRRDAIIADYAASAERIGAVLDRLRASATYAADISSRPVDGDDKPRAETMAAFLDQLDARYGGVPGWLAGQGFAATEADLLRAKLLRT